MKILITGLCFNGNLGGPALALGLRDGVLAKIPDAELTFAVTQVPGDVDTARSQYGCSAIQTPTAALFRHVKLPRFFYRLANRVTGKCCSLSSSYDSLKESCRSWKRVLRDSDAVVNLSGVAFVGDGMRHSSVAATELFPFQEAESASKPYARFIQSFGPFDDPQVAEYAKRELPHLHRIYARGHGTADACRELLPESDVRVFPDCAIHLKRSGAEWRNHYFERHDIPSGPYTIVSPSAVIRNKAACNGEAIGENYVAAVATVVEELISRGRRVFLLPHSRYPSNAGACDGDVCRQVFMLLPGNLHDGIHCVDELLTAPQAKELIGSAELAIVSRYHAAIAALSTATPIVTIGWNQKYRDVLELYGVPQLAVDARSFSRDELSARVLELAGWWADGAEGKIAQLESRQVENEKQLDQAFALLCDWLESTQGRKK